MDPLLLAIMGGAGAAKYYASDLPQYNREKELASQTQRYSPWTGLTSQVPQNPSLFNDVLSGVGAGAALGQNLQNAKSLNQLRGAQFLNLTGAPPPGADVTDPESDWANIFKAYKSRQAMGGGRGPASSPTMNGLGANAWQTDPYAY